jgi:hypothetical protein
LRINIVLRVADLNRCKKMSVPDSRELLGVYRPSVGDKLIAVGGVAWALTLAFAVLHVASRSYGVDRFDWGFIISFFLCALVLIETNLRTVTVDQVTVSQRSPLGFYRQSLQHDRLSGLRLTHLGRGYIAEACCDGRWIVFCSNRTFRRRMKRGPNQSPSANACGVAHLNR